MSQRFNNGEEVGRGRGGHRVDGVRVVSEGCLNRCRGGCAS